MDLTFKQLMSDARRLTRAGDVASATRTIQQALRGGSGAQRPDVAGSAGAADAPLPNVDPMRVIEGEWTRLDDASATEPEERSQARESLQAERIVRARHVDGKGVLDYRLFVPTRVPGAVAPPLLVMLHGCTQDAEDFALGTRMDTLARQHGCLVLYPDQSDRASPQRCWNWFKHTHQRRGGGEAGLIERCVRGIVAEHGVDTRRVFVAGLSAGGAMAAILGSVCADLFAGIGVHSGLAAGSATNLPEALAAMQRGAPAAAVVAGASPPTIVFHGDADRTVHPANAERIVEGCRRAANGAGAASSVASSVQRQAGGQGARGWTRRVHRDAGARIIAEQWCVHGAGHAWSGGDRRGSYTDAAGPDASAEMLRFFLALAPA